MSRIGKKPIPIPGKTKVSLEGDVLVVQGAKGTLRRTMHPGIDVALEDAAIRVAPKQDGKDASALQGLMRSLIANMVTGVTTGFERVLEISGIGYRAELSGKQLVFALGYSHPINFDLPEGISASVEKNTIVKLTGIDKELLGHTAAAIRRLRPPEPYKGKGVKFAEERIIRKAGKTGKK